MMNSMDKNDRINLVRFEKGDVLAGAICLIFLCGWCAVHLFKYYHFQYGDWDLAFFSQAMWNLSRGSIDVSLLGKIFFANHSNFIAFFVLPLFLVFSHPLVLVFLKLILFFLGSFIFYRMARQSIEPKGALVLMLLYILYLPNIFGLLYEFDFESLAPVFLFLIFHSFMKRNLRGFWMMAMILMLIKENMPLIILAFGAYGLFTEDRNKWVWGVVPVVVGAGVFCFLTIWFIPHMSDTRAHPYLEHYRELGVQSADQLILVMASNPVAVLKKMFSVSNLMFANEILIRLVYLPLYSLHVLFLGSPIFFQHALSKSFQEKTIIFHYVLTLAPFVFLAALNTLRVIRDRLKPHFYFIILTVFVSAAVFDIYLNWDWIWLNNALTDRRFYLSEEKWELVRRVPKQAAVVSTFNFLPAFSQRQALYSLHKIYVSAYQTGKRPFVLPDEVDYALVDFNDVWLDFETSVDKQQARDISRRLRKWLDQGWGVKDQMEDVVLFQKGRAYPPLIFVQEGESYWPERQGIMIAEGFSFVSVQANPSLTKGRGFIDLRLNWLAHRSLEKEYGMVLILMRDGQSVLERYRKIGYAIYPTLVWNKGDYVQESYKFFLPHLKAGKYYLQAVFTVQEDQAYRVLDAVQDGKTVKSVRLTEFTIM